MSFVLSLAWGVCLGLSFVGAGLLLLTIIGVRERGVPLAAAVGVSVFVAVGGLLNLLQLVSRPILICLIGLSTAAAVVGLRRHLGFSIPVQRRDRLLLALLVLLLLVPVLGNIRPDVRSFSWYDDLPAYLTLPVETLQLHQLPFDPFNERRITSSLGAPYVLQAAMLVPGEARSIRFVDIGIGTVLYAALLMTIFRALELSLARRLLLTLCIFVVPLFRLNATMVALPAALFCCLFLLEIDSELSSRMPFRQAFLMGLTVAALTALKSNYLPAAVCMAALYFLAQLIFERRKGAIAAGLVCALTAGLCLLPWMIDMKRKEGTWLFPILGRGYDASFYGTIPLPNGSHGAVASGALWVWLTVLPMAGPLLLALIAASLAYRERCDRSMFPALASILLGSALAIAFIASSTGGESMGRYSLPFQIPALLIFAGFLVRWKTSASRRSWWFRPAAMITSVVLLFLALLFGIRHKQYRVFAEDAGLVTPIPAAWYQPDVERSRLAIMQARVPQGEPILARIFVSYSLNFRRNPIYIADYTGMAGLPPGMPVDGRPESMAGYLLEAGIRYLAYDYKRTMLPDDDPQSSLGSVLQHPERYGRHAWLYMQVKVSNFEGKTFSRMGKSCRALYDDGTMFLLDLRTCQAQR